MDSLYRYFVDIKFVMLQQLPNILFFLVIVLGSWLIQHYIVSQIMKRIVKRYEKHQMAFKKEIWEHIEKPLRNLVFGMGCLLAISYALHVSIFKVDLLSGIFKTLLIFFFFQGLYVVATYFGEHPDTLKSKFNIKADNVLFPFFARIIKFIVVLFGFALLMFEWGYDINGFFAGLGIGGLAIALGAKDALSHIFAGISMAIDKPFAIGDLISTDNNLEGIVEDMNLRSTRIRTLDKALVSVPNAVIANQYIYNWTRRKNRRVRFVLGLTYSTTEKQLKTVTDRIRDVILAHPHVEQDSVTTAFDAYTPDSLDLLILYITDTSDFNEYMVIKEEVNYEIMKILQEEKVYLAFPSQSIYFKNKLTVRDVQESMKPEQEVKSPMINS